MRFFVPLMLCIAFMQTACGTASTPSEQSPTTPTSSSSPTPTPATSGANSNVALSPLSSDTSLANQARYVGRFNFTTTPGQATFTWPSTSIGINFSGTGLSAQLGDLQVMEVNGATAHNTFDVSVDGGAATSITMSVGLSARTLASNLQPGNHTLWLTKRTEAIVGSAVLGGFTATGGTLLTPPAPRAHRIEVYGDSNEAGYGDLATVTAANMCTFSYETEDADIAYPQLVATQLGADLTTMAYAGIGIYQDAFPSQDPNPMPSVYDLIDPTDPNSTFDFSTSSEPDVVIVDLGGNDFYSYTPPEGSFVSAYAGFLETIRGHYPKAPIISVMGPTMVGTQRTDMQTWIAKAIAQRQSAGDTNITFLAFAEYDGSTYGCDYHPDAAMHQTMATTILPSISRILDANSN